MDIHLINRKLTELFGKDFLDQPNFRVIYSDDEIEKRIGDFEDYIPGTNVLIRRVREVRETKKYGFMEPQYVLERLFFNRHNDEILDNSTLSPRTCTYEPLWCFGVDKKGRPNRPVWRAIELLIEWHFHPKKMSPSDITEAEFKKAEEDEKVMLELLNTYIPNDALHSSIQDGDTIMMNDATRKKND